MAKKRIEVIIKDGSQSWTYNTDWAYVFMMSNQYEKRAVQQPQGWTPPDQPEARDVCVFYAALEALNAVADTEGEEVFREAARKMLSTADKVFAKGEEK